MDKLVDKMTSPSSLLRTGLLASMAMAGSGSLNDATEFIEDQEKETKKAAVKLNQQQLRGCFVSGKLRNKMDRSLRSVEHRLPRHTKVEDVSKRHGIGRNDPCPCGSKKKYKKCCGAPPPVDLQMKRMNVTALITSSAEEIRKANAALLAQDSAPTPRPPGPTKELIQFVGSNVPEGTNDRTVPQSSGS